MSNDGATVSAAGSANETPEIPDNVGDWLWGVYRFGTDRNDFWRKQMESCAEPKSSKKQPTICDHQKMCPDGS
uniref:Uncharacterized protein n=1 Tax=Rhinopithecus bieti TaxID=61621 RepID=A0A2K6LLZ9_RHIBE